ncbi:MAG TPA: sensor histidine kinase [Solirubrobacteraceae bacterium]|jgi:two-component system NarL family sensor kinase|nr:sensor histidine kinase [Solirubrobacteraceae bacterium]
MGPWSRSPVVQFAASGLAATILIALVTLAAARQIGTDEAIRDAKQLSRFAGEGIVEPALDRSVVAGDPQALARLDRIVRARVLRDDIVRVKLWDADGRIVYSDEPRLIGSRYPLDVEEREALRDPTAPVDAEVSDLSRPENRFERDEKKLLEVYLPVHDETGRPLMFEAYQRYSAVTASSRRVWLAFAPAVLGALLLLQLVNLLLARGLARRLQRGQREREALLNRALEASNAERRLIAADLHDGVVQDLVGVSYALAAEAERTDGGEAGEALRRGAATTRDSVRALRTLLVDIFPPSLHRAGLAAALGDLARTSTTRGIDTTLAMADDLELPDTTEQLLYRCAQEALRNAHKHSGADTARVSVAAAGDSVMLTVSDNGRGFDPSVLETRPEEGHFGLSMLTDMVRDAGGRLQLDTGDGTTVRVELPR